MKRQDLVKYHQQSIAELTQAITKLEQQLVEARMQKELDQLKDVHTPQKIRRDIARLKTIMTHKKLTNQETK